MKGKGGVIANKKLVASAAWQLPVRDGDTKHVRFMWIKRGGVGRQSGSGASGYKLNPAKVLARSLAERPGVAALVRQRQERITATVT